MLSPRETGAQAGQRNAEERADHQAGLLALERAQRESRRGPDRDYRERPFEWARLFLRAARDHEAERHAAEERAEEQAPGRGELVGGRHRAVWHAARQQLEREA